jgi:uncharacterized protein (TIGR03382 family)
MKLRSNKSLTLALLVASVTAARAAISATGLEVYYSYDAGTVSSTVVTDQWTADGNTDNVGRNTLTTFASGAKFGEAINVTSIDSTPRSATDAATINGSFMPGTGDYTLTFWYRQQAAGSNRIFGAGARGDDANNDDGLQLFMLGATGYELAVHDPAVADTNRLKLTTGAAGIFDGTTWNHFAIIRDGTGLSLWVNGSEIGSGTLPDGYNIAVGSETYFREAAFGPNGSVTGAAYDDAAIFKRALSGSEIGQIWNGGTGGAIGSLVPEPSSAAVGMLVVAALFRRRRSMAQPTRAFS